MSKRPGFIHYGGVGRAFAAERRTFVTTDGFVHDLDKNGFRFTHSPGNAELRVLTIGCSFSFGYGLPYPQIASARIARLLEEGLGKLTADINLSVPGTSNDYIIRQLFEVAELMKPHVIFVAFTQPARREFWWREDKHYSIRPRAAEKDEWSDRRRELQHDLERIENQWNDLRRLYLAVRTCALIARSINAAFVYTYATFRKTPPIQEWMSPSGFIGFVYPRIDLAGDSAHPGPRSNQLLALAVVSKLMRDGPVTGQYTGVEQHVENGLKGAQADGATGWRDRLLIANSDEFPL